MPYSTSRVDKARGALIIVTCVGIYYLSFRGLIALPSTAAESFSIEHEQHDNAAAHLVTDDFADGLATISSKRRHFNKETYSSFRCIGGSQTFPGMNMHHSLQVYQGWPEANNRLNRVCLFENVCWEDDNFVYYEDSVLKNATPSSLWPDSFAGEMLSTGQNPLLWSPVTRLSPLPKGVPLLSDANFLLNGNSNSDNFAHLLLDDLIPSLTALWLFDLPLDSGQLLSQNGCRQMMQYYNPNDMNPIKHRSRSDVCRENFDLYTPLVLGRGVVDLAREWNGTRVCVKHLIAGQSSAFSLRSLDLERGMLLRVARDLIVQRLGLDGLSPPASHDVMVLLKQRSFASPTWTNLCEDTRTIMRAVSPDIPVRCFNPVDQTIAEQVSESLKSSLIVAEHGTTSYGAIFGHDGIVLLSIATQSEVKDTHIHLYASHYETYFFTAEEKETAFEGMLRFTLAKAASNFGFNANCTGLCTQ